MSDFLLSITWCIETSKVLMYVDPPLTLTDVWLVELSAHIGRAIESRGSLAVHRKQIDTLIIRSWISIRVPYSRLHFFTGVTQILQERRHDGIMAWWGQKVVISAASRLITILGFSAV
jgi:hypothetical protein